MSTITPKEVRAIAALSRIALSDEEVVQATRDLSSIFNHFSAIGGIDTTDVSPASDASGLINSTREDIPKPNILCLAQDLVEGYVRVPGVFEETVAL